jgi:hypothetical protein
MEHTTTYELIDRAILALAGALMLLGVVVLGVVEILAGQPYGAAPLTNDAGDVIAQPLIDPTIRTGLFIAGLAVLGLWGLYRMTVPLTEDEAAPTEMAAD